MLELDQEQQDQAKQILSQTFPRKVSGYRITVRPVSRSNPDEEHYVLCEHEHNGKRILIGVYSTYEEAHRINRQTTHIVGNTENRKARDRAQKQRVKAGHTTPALAEYPIRDIKRLRTQIRMAKPDKPNLWAKAKAKRSIETFRFQAESGWVISGYTWNPKTEEIKPAILAGAEHIDHSRHTQGKDQFEQSALDRAYLIQVTAQDALAEIRETLEVTYIFRSEIDQKKVEELKHQKAELIEQIQERWKELLEDYSDVKAQPWAAKAMATRWRAENSKLGRKVHRVQQIAIELAETITEEQWQNAVKESEREALEAFKDPRF